MLFANIILLFIGSALLSLSIQRHYRFLLGSPLSKRTSQLLKSAGWASLVCALGIFVAVMGLGIGTAVFMGTLMLTFFATAITYPTIAYFRSVNQARISEAGDRSDPKLSQAI